MQPTALIVDDSPFVRAIIRHHLVAAGFSVVGEAENAEDGLKLFRDLRPNLVTLDVMMPVVGELDSLAAFRAIRKENPESVVVVVSVLPFEKVRESFLKEGAIAYITKPFNQYSFEPVRQRLTRVFPDLAR